MADEEQRETINLETKDKETTKTDDLREKESVTEDFQVSKSKPTKEAEPTELVTKPKPQTELGVGEYVESDSEPEMAIKSETKPEKDEYQEELRDNATEVKDISLKDEIKTEKTDKNLKLKIEVGDTKVQRKGDSCLAETHPL